MYCEISYALYRNLKFIYQRTITQYTIRIYELLTIKKSSTSCCSIKHLILNYTIKNIKANVSVTHLKLSGAKIVSGSSSLEADRVTWERVRVGGGDGSPAIIRFVSVCDLSRRRVDPLLPGSGDGEGERLLFTLTPPIPALLLLTPPSTLLFILLELLMPLSTVALFVVTAPTLPDMRRTKRGLSSPVLLIIGSLEGLRFGEEFGEGDLRRGKTGEDVTAP